MVEGASKRGVEAVEESMNDLNKRNARRGRVEKNLSDRRGQSIMPLSFQRSNIECPN